MSLTIRFRGARGSVERPFRVGSALVRAARLHHPNGVCACRIEAGGRAVVYATDTEHHADRIDRNLVHDPAHDDAAVAAIERAAQTVSPGMVAAREGLTIHLAGRVAKAA